MRHTPGKRTPAAKRASGHYMTRAKIASAALAKMKNGETIAAQSLWMRIETQQTKPSLSQQQRRKFNRQRYAAGDRHAFA